MSSPDRVRSNTHVVAAHRCLACLSTSVRVHPPSRRTGFVIHECRDCGLHALADRSDLDTLVQDYDSDKETYAAWTEITRGHVIDKSHAQALDRISGLVGPVEDRSLFDVGAGDGGFLAMARDAGFRPTGNELSSGAIELAKEANDIDLMLGDLSTLPDAGQHDALSMWCVLAHVPDGDKLLLDAMDALKPGGVLFLQTPRWSAMDTAGMMSHDLTRGRATRITDRRMAMHHMSLHTAKSMRLNLKRLGYEVIGIEPRARYSLTTANYLESLGVPEPMLDRLARMLDTFVERDLFFRNVLDVYARKPRG